MRVLRTVLIVVVLFLAIGYGTAMVSYSYGVPWLTYPLAVVMGLMVRIQRVGGPDLPPNLS